MEFVLDSRLAADTLPLCHLDLCEVRLMDDRRYPWLVLVPRRPTLSELWDLSAEQQAQLWREVAFAGAALHHSVAFDKLNIATLGNIVRQLHIHVVGRRSHDAAWPAPVWGHSPAIGYVDQEWHALRDKLNKALQPPIQ